MAQTPIDFYKPLREAVHDALLADSTLQTMLGNQSGGVWYHDRRYGSIKVWPSIGFRVIDDGIDTSGTMTCAYRPRVEIVAYHEDPDTLRQIIYRVRALLTWPCASPVGTALDIDGFRADSLRCESIFNDPIPVKKTDTGGDVFALPTDWQCSLKQTG